MTQAAVRQAQPGWDELCRRNIGRGLDGAFEREIDALKADCPDIRFWIVRRVVERLMRDPSAVRLIELGWEAVVEIVVDQAVGMHALKKSGLEPMALRPVCPLEFDGFHRPFSQLPCTRATTAARVQKALQIVERGEPVLVLGDDDMVSVALAQAGFSDVTAVDIDDAIIASIDAEARRLGVRVKTVQHDLIGPFPARLRTPPSSLVFIDPMYSLDGVQLFVKNALEAIDRRAGAWIFLSANLLMLGETGLEHVRQMLAREGLVMDEVLQHFNSYAVPVRVRWLLDIAIRLLFGSAFGGKVRPFSWFFSDAVLLRKT